MSSADRADRNVKTWLPRIWGFVLGAAALVSGSFIVSIAFTDAASRDPGSDIEYVYPYDL